MYPYLYPSALEQRKTPFYLYDMKVFRKTLSTLKESSERYDILVNYAVKANNEKTLVSEIRDCGFGMDCVSGNEVKLALDLGFQPKSISFAGVGKTDAEIDLAVNSGIGALVVESAQEAEVIDERAKAAGRKASVMIRVNPNIDAHTARQITTGLEENKFGLEPETAIRLAKELSKSENLIFQGLQMHIGSQITDMKAYALECIRMSEVVAALESEGVTVEHISIGGGLAVDYQNPDANPVPDFEGWLKTIDENLVRRPGQKVHIEPGRSLVAQCSSLISKVLYVKEGPSRKFLILDAGMNDLIRPALYGSYHKIENISSEGEPCVYDVVGPVCESSDVFGEGRILPESHRGDIIAIRSAGAYGTSMSNRYNLKDLAESLYV